MSRSTLNGLFPKYCSVRNSIKLKKIERGQIYSCGFSFLLDFPVREVHCDALAETEWEILAQNVQWLQANPTPQSQKLDWIREVKIFIFIAQKIY